MISELQQLEESALAELETAKTEDQFLLIRTKYIGRKGLLTGLLRNISQVSDDEKPLFGSDNALTLDSVDGLEIIMALQRKYGIRIGDQNLARSIIRSINSIADFITQEKAKLNG